MNDNGTAITRRARERFDERQVALIQKTVAADCTTAELHMFLELAARYELDPFAGQIYAVKMPGRNAGPGRVTIITSRDGFLTIANRHADFEGMEGDVVRAKDAFKRLPDGTIEHAYSGGVAGRGEIVGAWAKVFRAGRRPTYFFAPWGEYGSQKSAWKDYPSAMILKCAESTALRKAFNISGLVGEEEVTKVLNVAPPEPEGPNFGDDPELAERLRRLFAALNSDETRYRSAKMRAMLAGLDDEQRLAIAHRLEGEIVEADLPMPEPDVTDDPVVETTAEEAG